MLSKPYADIRFHNTGDYSIKNIMEVIKSSDNKAQHYVLINYVCQVSSDFIVPHFQSICHSSSTDGSTGIKEQKVILLRGQPQKQN
jgi:hypothetical protein